MSGDVMPVEKYPQIISSLSTADVQVIIVIVVIDIIIVFYEQAAAKKLAGSKLAMGAVGNLSSVPHLDAL